METEATLGYSKHLQQGDLKAIERHLNIKLQNTTYFLLNVLQLHKLKSGSTP